MNTGNIIKQGYLLKKGQLLKGWSKRWFTYDGKSLAYYSNRNDPTANQTISLKQCSIEYGGISETYNTPRIHLTDESTGTMYCLTAENADVVNEWLEILRMQISRCRNTIPQPKSSDLQSKREKTLISTDLDEPTMSMLDTVTSLLSYRSQWQLESLKNGILCCTFVDSNNTRFAKGSLICQASPELVLNNLLHINRIGEWDQHFSAGRVVQYQDDTQVIHLWGYFKRSFYDDIQLNFTFSLIGYFLFFIATLLSIYYFLLGSFFFSLMTTFFTLLNIFIVVLLLVHFFKKHIPCDFLFQRQIFENPDGCYFIIEKSISCSEVSAPTGIRPTASMNVWLIQPTKPNDGSQTTTLLTHMTNMSIPGNWNSIFSKQFLIQRIRNLASLQHSLHYVQQTPDLPLFFTKRSIQLGQETFDRVDNEENDMEWCKGMERVSTGGLKLVDAEIVKRQKGVLMDVLKTYSSMIMEGKSVVGLSLPVRIFEPRSMLERIVDCWLYAPTLLKAASEANSPMERFKYVIAFAVGGLHMGCGQLKPFNPILGETYQTNLDDGTEVYCEHTKHNPPVSNFLLISPIQSFTLWGYFIFTGSFSTNAITYSQNGPIYIDFSDGTRISYHMPDVRSSGFLWGDRIVELIGSMKFTDERNNLKCELIFNPDEKRGMSSMFSTSKTPSDVIRGSIINTSTNGELAKIEGSWLENLKIDDTTIWDLERDVCAKTVKLASTLPSDSRSRPDLQHLSQGDLENAQASKLSLEKLQRDDRAIRNAGRRDDHWSFNP